MKFTWSIRDAVYGAIPVTSYEQEVMRLPMLGRLRNIKQLGLAYLAFPGANHTRFEHSVGTMHVAYLMGQSLGIDEFHLQAVRLAALLHDVGHAPFSHSLDFAFQLSGMAEIPSHVEISRQKIASDPGLTKILASNIPLMHQEDIASIATGALKDRLLSRIIDGPLDADKIDYILRDNHHCGFPVALDINTITETFQIIPDRAIALREAGMSFAEQLFVGRYHLITKIHHNRINRVANYLLALSISESLKKVEGELDRVKIIKQMSNEWTDADLISFLEKSSTHYFPMLRQMMLGEETLIEEGAFGYADLSPLGRYNIFVLSEHLESLPTVSTKLQEALGNKELFLDAYSAKPPETTLPVNVKPRVLLIDLPLTRGAVDASLEQVYFSVYSTAPLKSTDFKLDEIVEQYRQNLDPTFTKLKADGLIKKWASSEVDLKAFLLRHLVEMLANFETINIRKNFIIPSDLLLLVFNSLHSSFMKAFQRKVYIDSLRQFAIQYNELKSKISGWPADSSYNIEQTAEGFEFPANFMVDMERLERYGLIHRFTRAIKAGERFTQKHQLRITGWGKAYYQRNLSQIDALKKLNSAVESFFDTKVSVSGAAYNEYFSLLEKAEKADDDRAAEFEAEKKRKELPIQVTN